MHILMTADTVGGVWTYALELARALETHGVHITLATMGAPLRPAQWEEARALPSLDIHESGFKLEWMDDPWDDVRAAGRWLLRLADRVRPDVVHLNGYAHAALPWNAPTLVVAHSCVVSWWRAVKGEAAPRRWDCYRRHVTQGLQTATLVAAPTQAMLDALFNGYGPLPATTVIPNGRDEALFMPAAKDPFILSAGRLWDEAKNVAMLDRAAARLPWPVYVAGDAAHPGGGVITTRGVRLLGALPPSELAVWLSRAAIYALPARYEPFGLSALEAAFAGCALVLGDIPSLREVWGDAALYVPPDDADALRGALCALMAAPERRTEMASRARARADRYTPAHMADGYRAAYANLM